MIVKLNFKDSNMISLSYPKDKLLLTFLVPYFFQSDTAKMIEKDY